MSKLLLIVILSLQFSGILSKCCKPFWVREPKNIVEKYPLKSLDCHVDDDYCYYETCGVSGTFDNYYFNKSIPLDVSLSQQKFNSNNYFCGKEPCVYFIFGCYCFTDCQTDVIQDPHISCVINKRSTKVSCTYNKQLI